MPNTLGKINWKLIVPTSFTQALFNWTTPLVIQTILMDSCESYNICSIELISNIWKKTTYFKIYESYFQAYLNIHHVTTIFLQNILPRK